MPDGIRDEPDAGTRNGKDEQKGERVDRESLQEITVKQGIERTHPAAAGTGYACQGFQRAGNGKPEPVSQNQKREAACQQDSCRQAVSLADVHDVYRITAAIAMNFL